MKVRNIMIELQKYFIILITNHNRDYKLKKCKYHRPMERPCERVMGMFSVRHRGGSVSCGVWVWLTEGTMVRKGSRMREQCRATDTEVKGSCGGKDWDTAWSTIPVLSSHHCWRMGATGMWKVNGWHTDDSVLYNYRRVKREVLKEHVSVCAQI